MKFAFTQDILTEPREGEGGDLIPTYVVTFYLLVL